MGPAIWKESERLAQLPESLGLSGYIWSRGQFRNSFTRDDGGEVPRSAWERSVWGDLVHSQLLWILTDAALEDLVATGTFQAWRADPRLLQSAAKEVAQRTIRKCRTIRAHCLLGINKVEAAGVVELEPGITLKQLSTVERCLHLTSYSREYSSDDLSAPFFDVCLTMTGTVQDLSDHSAGLMVADAIDRVKWALCIACQRDFAVDEGPAVIRTADGWRCRTLRRDTPLLQSNRQFEQSPLTADQCAKAGEALRVFREARSRAPDLNKAMWLFGRACTASLARDSLLDAVIGLDSLLVPGGGEGRYRLALHGSALLTQHNPKIAYERLNELYSLRSAAAHSGGSQDKRFKEMAPIARMYFATIIYRIMTLINSNAIALAAGKTIAHAVERWIHQRLIDGVSATELKD